MGSSWIRDKVVAVAEAEAAETGEDANEIIWQLSKELGTMVQVGGQDQARLSALKRFHEALDDALEANPDLPVSDQEWTDRAERIRTKAQVPKDVPESLETVMDRIRATKYTTFSSELLNTIQSMTDYELAELAVELRVERQRRIDSRDVPKES